MHDHPTDHAKLNNQRDRFTSLTRRFVRETDGDYTDLELLFAVLQRAVKARENPLVDPNE